MISFDESRNNAYRLLSDAADEIRMGDWEPAPTAEQRAEILAALDAIGKAKDAIVRAAGTGSRYRCLAQREWKLPAEDTP